jgi:hypothetical protein
MGVLALIGVPLFARWRAGTAPTSEPLAAIEAETGQR